MNNYVLNKSPAGSSSYKRVLHNDSRGIFTKIFSLDFLNQADVCNNIVEVNHSFTNKKGTIRGLHYQNPPDQEDKFIACVSGSIYQVAVNLNSDSDKYLSYDSYTISSNDGIVLYVPKGMAHGFQTLEDNVSMIYLHTSAYSITSDAGLNPFDPKIGIQWPMDLSIISEKDRNLELL